MDMLSRLPGVWRIERNIDVEFGGRPFEVDAIVEFDPVQAEIFGLTPNVIVEVRSRVGAADVRSIRSALNMVMGVRRNYGGLVITPGVVSDKLRADLLPTVAWDRDALSELARRFPDALAPMRPFLEAAVSRGRPAASSKSETSGAEPPSVQPRVSLVVTDEGWRLPCDAFVLRLGPGGAFEGASFEAFQAATGGALEDTIIAALSGRRLGPENPLLCLIRGDGLPRNLILATAYRGQGGPSPGVAVSAILRLVEEEGLKSIALPLIGATDSDDLSVLDAIKRAIDEISLSRPLHVIVVLGTGEDAAYARRLFPDAEIIDQPPTNGRAESATALPWVNSDAIGRGPVVDQLGVQGKARTFATLLAAGSTPMPLAIGLFGNWGSGKSFFMKLIRQEMEAIAKTAPADGAYCTNVAHITFNAWYYLDSNLWASLALRIFDGVAAQLAGRDPDRSVTVAVAKERRRLAESVSSNRRLRAEAEEAIKAIQDSRAATEAAIAAKLSERKAAAAKVSVASLGAALAKLHGGDWQKDLKALTGKLGKDVPNDLAQLETCLADVNRTATSVAALLPGFVLGWPVWLRTGVIVSALLGLSYLVAKWPDVQSHLASLIHVNFEPAVAALSSLTALAAWVAQRINTVKQVPAQAAGLLKRLEEARGVLLQAGPGKDDEGLKAVARLDQDIEAQRQRVTEADKEIASAVTRLQQIEAGALMYDFVRERGSDRQYLDRTGIISVLRQDLERLEDQLERLGKEKGSKVQRIVLYIDDLDRCEPCQVVEVLQAVHLLLAYKLFAVVVAVDARWLERSLYKRYLDGHEDMTDDERAASEFSPQNYLEKIFQIPYRMPGLGKEPFQQLVSSLARRSAPDAAAGATTGGLSENDDGDADDGEETGERESALSSSDSGGTDALAADVSKAADAAAEPSAPAEVPPPLELAPHEIAAMSALHDFVATPRAAKRLMNVYVMIRMQIAEGATEHLVELSDETRSGARDLITLLAIDIGFPRAAQTLRHALGKAVDDGDIRTTIDGLTALCGPDQMHLRGQFRALDAALTELPSRPSIQDLRRWLNFVDRFSFHEAEAVPEAGKKRDPRPEPAGPSVHPGG